MQGTLAHYYNISHVHGLEVASPHNQHAVLGGLGELLSTHSWTSCLAQALCLSMRSASSWMRRERCGAPKPLPLLVEGTAPGVHRRLCVIV